ncbi:MAG: TonB-dependent receptor plug domain-containing protein, partial [Runella zeae]
MYKKLQIQTQVWAIMKMSFQQILFVIFFCGISLAHSSKAQDVLNQPLSLDVNGIEIKKVLNLIEKQAKVRFIYSSSAINITQKVKIKVSNQRLDLVLKELLKPISIEYQVIDNRILLKNSKNEQSVLPNEDQQLIDVIQPTQLPISGTIKDEKGVTMAGVSILIKGTSRGTTTDVNGNFKIDVPDKSTELIISYVGYLSQQITVGNRTQINITLLPDERSLNEVQVVAFGEQRKRDVTGSIASLKAADIRANTAASPDIALQGRAAGVQITQAGGTPGGAVRINVRGVASINSNSQPLIVIDGQPVNSSAFGTGGVAMNPLAEINPDDIESMEVLKDASASILFGSRAANGVILITTKKGAKGKPTIDFSYQQGINTATNRVDFIDNGADHFNILKRAARNNIQAGLAPASSNLTSLVPTGILRGSLPASFDNQLIDSTTLYNTR